MLKARISSLIIIIIIIIIIIMVTMATMMVAFSLFLSLAAIPT
jgi:hypothetical protein